MIRAFDDVEVLIFARSAFVEVVAHPFTTGDTPCNDLQRLSEKCLGLVVRIVGNDLGQAPCRCITRGCPIFRSGRVVVLPGLFEFLVGRVFLA